MNTGHYHPEVSVSVIIPAFRAANTISRSLLSVGKQTRLPAEVIVIDDGSDDETVNVVTDLKRRFFNDNLKVIKQQNQGPGAARNKGVRSAKGEIVAFLDSDDEWLPNKIEESLNVLVLGKYDIVAHNGWVINDLDEKYLDISSHFQAAKPSVFHALYKRGFISTSSVVAKRESILAAGGFDESLAVGQDFDLWLKLVDLKPNAIHVFDKPLARYHVTPGSVTSFTKERLGCTLDIAYRHFGKLTKHRGSPSLSFSFRIIAIHIEALLSYKSKGQFLNFVWTLCLLNYRLLKCLKVLLLSFKIKR